MSTPQQSRDTVTVVMARGFAQSMIALLNSLASFLTNLPIALQDKNAKQISVTAHVEGLNLLRDAITTSLDTPKVEARFKIAIDLAGSTDFGVFEIGGTSEWVSKTMPHVAFTIAQIGRIYGYNAENAKQAQIELVAAQSAMAAGNSYNGEVVTLTLNQ